MAFDGKPGKNEETGYNRAEADDEASKGTWISGSTSLSVVRITRDLSEGGVQIAGASVHWRNSKGSRRRVVSSGVCWM